MPTSAPTASKPAQKPVAKKAPAKSSTSSGTVKARPQHSGKDPLAEGQRLYNVPNTSEAKTYSRSKPAKSNK